MESETTISAAPLDGLSTGGQRARPLHGRTTGPTRRSTKGQWTTEEDEILQKAVERFKGKNWKKIAEYFKDRTDVQCLHRWQKVLNPELVKGPWSKEEDAIIVEMVKKYGPKKWSTIAQHLPGRIGKQCRERWHNHLNPSISKEAWTQEEELALIRAHQMYGNKWAELSKFLPGRTDNAIKNHWNSSVKKKLDSYIASGLLAQFPDLPPSGYQNHFVQSASRMQSSGDDTVMKGGTEAEEISDCSQGSAFVGCSQSGEDMVLQRSKDLQLVEETAFGVVQNSTQASSSVQYYSATDEATLSIPDMYPEISCPSNLPVHFSGEDGTCRDQSYQFSSNDLPHISLLELAQGSLGFPPQGTSQSHDDHFNIPFPSSMGALGASSARALAVDTEQLHHILISDEECCRFLFSETANNGGFSSENHVKATDRSVSQHQSSDIHATEGSGGLSEPYDNSRLEGLDGSAGQCYMASPLPNQSVANQEIPWRTAQDGFICTNDMANSSYDSDTIGTMEPLDLPEDKSRLVAAGNLHFTSVSMPTCSLEEPEMEKEDSGSLCYDPPRFPSLDIPFLSCDLIQSSNDAQIDYSPLGIRQLMMSSMNCISPFRLWDSPSHDSSSPEGVLKSAAKTFTNPPSILRKRSRDLLSPLSDRRMDKKLEMDIASNLSRDFSRLDVVVVDGSAAGKTSLASSSEAKMITDSLDDKENIGYYFGGGQDKGDQAATFDGTHDSDCHGCSKEMLDQGIADSNDKVMDDSRDPQSMEQPTDDVLTERDTNDLLLFSHITQPNQKTDKTSVAGSPGNSCQPVSSSPAIRRITCGSSQKRASGSKLSLHTSTPLEIVVDKDSGAENFSIFGGTPFKRSLESPSAWKSPWFMNSFLPGPRIETEITIEDIGYFMSPGDKSYDALSLMKHLSEHSAAAYANAQEILGNDTPEPANERNSYDENGVQGDPNPNQLTSSSSSLASNILIERRALDFSECGSPSPSPSPGKSKEQGRANSTSGVSFSSPSSYLLKGCR